MKDPFEWVGKTIDEQFAVEEVVGEGGFAVVYRGHHQGFDEKVAIKALKFPAKLGEDERAKFLESFKSEGKLLHKLSKADAAIVQALDVGAATSPNGTWTPYLILEWLEGQTLEADLKTRAKEKLGGRSLADAIALLDPVARGLATAHGMNVAHRDIKPANLFLKTQTGTTSDQKTEKRSLKIVDFGIAKVMSDSEDVMKAYEATGESIHAFSPRYGAPEQFARKYGATGPWTDVFALALVVIEVVAGKSAMRGDTAQLMAQAVDGVSRPTLRTLGVVESDAVELVLGRALAVETVERYRDAGKFWDALKDAAAQGDTVLSQREEDETVREGGNHDTEKSPGPPATIASRALQLAFAAAFFVAGAWAVWMLMPKHHFSFFDPEPTEKLPDRYSIGIPPPVDPRIAPVPSASASASSASSVEGFTHFTSEKGQFVIDVPDELTRVGEPAIGDGFVFRNAARDAQLEVFRATDKKFADVSAAEKRSDPDKHWVTAFNEADNTFIAEGKSESGFFYEKGLATGATGYALLKLSYPEKDKEHFAELIPKIVGSFGAAASSSSSTPQK